MVSVKLISMIYALRTPYVSHGPRVMLPRMYSFSGFPARLKAPGGQGGSVSSAARNAGPPGGCCVSTAQVKR